MNTDGSEYRDLHKDLLPYSDVLSHLKMIEKNDDMHSYCQGANESGRWFFQFLNKEFVRDLAILINRAVSGINESGPVLEVMSGDGRLTEFLRPILSRQIVATDAQDGRHNIAYPKWVVKMDAAEAVERFLPGFIVVSWEPLYSTTIVELVRLGLPIAWIGDPGSCATHSGILDMSHTRMNSQYALGRHDKFGASEFRTDVYIFNCDEDWFQS